MIDFNLQLFAISIHAPVKGATPYESHKGRYTAYFNPRTREGCDTNLHNSIFRQPWISIHAPVKGATADKDAARQRACISIHAPVKGATARARHSGARISNFNPRTREGCDARKEEKNMATYFISIHAPVKGATIKFASLTLDDIIFQSTHP